MTDYHYRILALLAVVCLNFHSGLCISARSLATIGGRQRSPWALSGSKKGWNHFYPPEVLVELKGGAALSPEVEEALSDTEDDAAEEELVEEEKGGSIFEMTKKMLVWYFMACKRSIGAAYQEFREPLPLSKKDKSSSLMVLLGLVQKSCLMTTSSVRAFFQPSNEAAAVKREASLIIRNSFSLLGSLRLKRAKAMETAESEEEEEGYEYDDDEEEEEEEEEMELQTVNTTNTHDCSSDEAVPQATGSTARSETPTDTTKSTSAVVPSTKPKQGDILRFANKVTSIFIVVTTASFLTYHAWEIFELPGLPHLIKLKEIVVAALTCVGSRLKKTKAAIVGSIKPSSKTETDQTVLTPTTEASLQE